MIQHWDGGTWSPVTAPTVLGSSSFLYGIDGVAPDDVWAVGYANVGLSTQLTVAVHWDGSAWTVVQTPSPSLDSDILWSVAALAPDDAWAIGYSQFQGDNSPLSVHWDGAAWSVVPTPDPDNSMISFLWGVEAVSATDVWSFGRTYDGSTYPSLVERWNGSEGTTADHPKDRLYNEMYDAVALAPDDVWAVGRHGDAFSNNIAVVSHWDGTEWSVVANPTPDLGGDSYLYAADAAAPDDVWAVGGWIDGFTWKTLVARYSRDAGPRVRPTFR
jgi:hypothetical protein